MEQHSTEEINKKQPLGSGLLHPLFKNVELFSINDVTYIKNEARKNHNKRIANSKMDITYEEYFEKTIQNFKLYNHKYPRLDGNRIYYTKKDFIRMENSKFN